ncbi:unnamed protein product [Clavelina lepadiformis]|uniref:Uncharacterized protein n=1 Tax=Clavelina lepadiformis TaxID=159417 RepID=A0ABP0FPL6_CLALP
MLLTFPNGTDPARVEEELRNGNWSEPASEDDESTVLPESIDVGSDIVREFEGEAILDYNPDVFFPELADNPNNTKAIADLVRTSSAFLVVIK